MNINVYLSILLEQLVKKINGIETSWALGAAINLLDFGDNDRNNNSDSQ